MFRNGNFVWNHIKPTAMLSKEDYEINPTGVDLTLHDVKELSEENLVLGKDYKVENRSRSIGRRDPNTDSEYFNFEFGYYLVNYSETIEIPEDHIGFILPRSTLMRNGIMLFTAVWDAGYKGKGVGGMLAMRPGRFEKHVRVGQLVLAKAEGSDISYDGQYQGENLEDFSTNND